MLTTWQRVGRAAEELAADPALAVVAFWWFVAPPLAVVALAWWRL